MSSPKRKFVIDTDCGLDDAQAIAMVVRNPSVDLLSLTLVGGNTSLKNVEVNVLRTLSMWGHLEVPVYSGCRSPLLDKDTRHPDYHGKDGFGDAEGLKPVDLNLIKKKHGVSALIDVVNENPGEVELLCLGPLTNVAMALRMDPDFGGKLKHCYIMGGNYKGRGNITAAAEFNFFYDPEAAYMILEHLKAPITIVPWEPCLKTGLSWDWYENEFLSHDTDQARFIKKIESKVVTSWGKDFPYVCCDQVIAAVALDPSIVKKSVSVCVTIALSDITRGMMVVDWDGYNKKVNVKKVNVVGQYDVEKFKQMLYTIVKPQ